MDKFSDEFEEIDSLVLELHPLDSLKSLCLTLSSAELI